MSGPASRREHKRFCDMEGWSEVKNARGKPVRHHITYELNLADGRILRTRISRPATNDRYGSGLWAAVLRDQLDVTEDEFWGCVDRGIRPRRPARQAEVPAHALPATLVYQLLNHVGLTEAQVAVLSKEEAVALLSAFWSRPAK